MSVSDFYLRFPDEATATSLLAQLFGAAEIEDGTQIALFTHGHAIDLIGTIHEEGNEIEPGEALPGWHVNLRILDGSPLPPELEPYLVTPEPPVRVWASYHG